MKGKSALSILILILFQISGVLDISMASNTKPPVKLDY